MNNSIYKIAVVGCGVISANHISAILECEGVEITALCDVKPERAEARRDEYKLNARIYTDYNEMLESEKPDAVHIATPHYLHAEMAIKALDLGINVFLEKPMCINREQIEAMLEAEKRSSAKICVCFQNRYNPSTIKAKEIADADGGVITAYGSVFWERNEPYYTESGWRGAYATEGGGVMINQAIHTIDLLCYYLGTPVSLIATKAKHHLKNVIEVEDTCEGIIYFENGIQANFYATTSALGTDDTLIILQTKNHRIELRLPNITVDGVTTSYEKDVQYVGKKCYGNGHEQLIARYYDALENGKDVPVSAESAKYALRILLAAYKSHDLEINI